MSKVQTTRRQVSENEFYVTEEVIRVHNEYTPNLEKLKAELIEYVHNNEIDGGEFRVVAVELQNSYCGSGKFVLYDLNHYYSGDDMEEDETEEDRLTEIDEDFGSDDAFEKFISSLQKKYNILIDHPGGYCPK